MNAARFSEDEIVSKLRGGELDSDKAFEALYMKLYPFLMRAALHYGSDKETAEEVVIDTLAQLPRFLESYKGRGSLRSYLIAVLRHRMLDYWRRSQRQQKIKEMGSIHERELEMSFGPATEDRTNIVQTVRELLEGLSEEERLIITARYFEDASNEEIAKTLGITPATVKSRLHRAMSKLHELLSKQKS